MADTTIRISRWKEITEEEALNDDWDMIPTLTAFAKTREFCQHLESHRHQVEDLISRHLGIPSTDFVLLKQDHWLWGSFNIRLPIDINRTSRTSSLPLQAMLRFALPFRCGEDYNPGNVEEKVRCEAATYIWLQRHCPSIPIPQLLAIGLPGGESFTAVGQESLWNRLIWQLRRCGAWFRGETLSPFFQHQRNHSLSDSGYLLLEYVMNGDPLSSTWQQHREDEVRRNNLYRSLSRILLDLMKVPHPRIGSWRLENNGSISLTNRPLFDLTMLWNRHKIPTGVPRDLTYTSTDSFIRDMISYQDNRLTHQPNSILGRPDGIFQLSALAALRALFPVFWKHTSQSKEFVLTLPDLHQSNIFVDDGWNIVSVIDFEFAPVQPQQMVGVPHWLSGRAIDELVGPALDEYKELHDRFIDILEEEEHISEQQNCSLSKRLREDWQTGKIWYNSAIRSSNAFPLVFENNIQPRFFSKFDPNVEGVALMRLWGEECEDFIATKLRDKASYDERIRAIFASSGQPRKVESNSKF